ncbi:Ig-specific serine endopeptidase MIP [Mycoplasmopsis gallopavonis]|uniref:Membrane-associated lipoprotein n=1 Tax=Mycoplasmopsis gallopavonis TaxID=76629 RepID=A0A449B0H3_9BACT|nr:DUF31 family protein [Mycoplasmopsis gallopavonis]RIV16449.1 hypothetical protein D1113_02310 [Mycoplasmopsis gallopavonis]VEU73228.1 Membrane-associated lipoprotein precursor [Mycoplasmopsis gallopavonis]
MKKVKNKFLLLFGLVPFATVLASGACQPAIKKEEPKPVNPGDNENGGSNENGSENQNGGGSSENPGENPSNPIVIDEDTLHITTNDLKYSITPENAKVINEYVDDEVDYFNRLAQQFPPKIAQNFKTQNIQIINAFNEQSKNSFQPYYIDSYLKNYSLPSGNNKIKINPIRGTFRQYYRKSTPGDRGTARKLANENYKQIALESYSIIFHNDNELIKNDPELKKMNVSSSQNFLGTAWILDYQLDETGKYPTKWYLATNLHVAMPFKKVAGSNDPYLNEPKLEEELNAQKSLLIREKEMEEEYKRDQALIEKYKKEQGPNSTKAKELEKKYSTADLNNLSPYIIEYNKIKKQIKHIADELQGKTVSVELNHFTKSTPINKLLETTSMDPSVEKISLDPSQVRIVYLGTNFLSQSPKDYLSNPEFQGVEEMADFAVLEIDFAKPKSADINAVIRKQITGGTSEETKYTDYHELAKQITAGYADLPSEQQSKPATYNVLTDYDKLTKEKVNINIDGTSKAISRINVNFLALGFPNADSDHTINRDALPPAQKVTLKFTSSLWTNKSSDPSKGIAEYGYGLSKSLAFRNFVDKPGITDITITSPLIKAETNEAFDVLNLRDKTSQYQGRYYINYGLGYVLNSWQPMAGASGSSVRDMYNNILGISYATADAQGISQVSLAQAFRSNGHNYNNQYGSYNLEQYDLIYGGGKYQISSYREKLMQIYGGNYKTKLFKQGTSVIPEEYKFKD